MRALSWLGLLMLLSGGCYAQDFPNRPITVVVPFPAGSATDVATRAITKVMQREMNVPFVVDNRAGAAGMVGAAAVARMRPDGYSLLMGGIGTHAANPYLFKQMSYSPTEDFVAVGSTLISAPILLAGPSTNVATLKDVVELARTKSEPLTFAVPSASAHFSTEVFKHHAKLQGTIVRYSSPPQAHVDVAAGRVDFIFGDFAAGGGLIQAGKLRPIAVAGPRRMAIAPDVPPFSELGYDVECLLWNGLFAPKGTPADIVARLNTSLVAALRDPDVTGVLKNLAQEPFPTTPAEFTDFVARQNSHWGKMAKLIRYQPE